MADKVAINQGFDWKASASELFETVLDVGKQYVNTRLSAQEAAYTTEQKAAATQSDVFVAKERTKTVLYIGVVVIGLFIVYKTIKKQRLI